MTLKEELEILRGEPIEVFTGDPMDIPCIETSDPEKLCKHPVVSVQMITYNHEPYIRQAIEGVMMQKTDFEFELIIGEDASTDKTREICFEYQKRYPDKIRVLWWHENLYRNPHPAGGNSRRVSARCRGEFIALCEGDDYWIDPLKLQKQVDVMRKHPNVSFCFCRAKIDRGDKSKTILWNEEDSYLSGVVPGREFLLKCLFGKYPREKGWPSSRFLMTATVLMRTSCSKEIRAKEEIFDWRLRLGDITNWMGLSTVGDAYYLPDVVAVYNQISTGACRSNGYRVGLDGELIRLYFHQKVFGRSAGSIPLTMQHIMVESMWFAWMKDIGYRRLVTLICRVLSGKRIRGVFFRFAFAIPLLLLIVSGAANWWFDWFRRFYYYLIDESKMPAWLAGQYDLLTKVDVRYDHM